jgi:hypothetical protein
MRMSVNAEERDFTDWSDQRETVVEMDSDERGYNVRENTPQPSSTARHLIERLLEEKRLKEVLFDVFEEESSKL